jgi:hypothetical protein
MDRLDCQFLMSMATAVHLTTFVRPAAVTAASVLATLQLMSPDERSSVLKSLTNIVANDGAA